MFWVVEPSTSCTGGGRTQGFVRRSADGRNHPLLPRWHEVCASAGHIARRNLTKGQQAMALAMIYPAPAALKRKGSGSLAPKEQGISSSRLSQARTVLRHSRAYAEDVLAGRQSDMCIATPL